MVRPEVWRDMNQKGCDEACLPEALPSLLYCMVTRLIWHSKQAGKLLCS